MCELRPGDILLVHTGFAALVSRPAAESAGQSLARHRRRGSPSGEEMCRYLWDAHVAAVASDTFAVEVFPPTAQCRPAFCTAC